MKIARHLSATFALLVVFASGCQMFLRDHPMLHGNSPLKPAPASPDSVAMEIIWARFPANDPVLDESAWRTIDETQIEPSVRRELANNGLRAGIICGSLPPAIDKVLHQGATPEAAPTDSIAKAGQDAQQKSTVLLTEPIVHGRTRRLRRHEKFEIQASEIYPSLPLLLSGGAELGGHTYEQAQAIYSLRVDPRSDRTAMVELTPELHHGAARLRFTGGDDGILRQASLKDREVFDRLRISAKLAPGEMLVLMSMADAGSRLGHYFHTVDSSDGPQQKLVLLRLAEVPPSDTFADVASPLPAPPAGGGHFLRALGCRSCDIPRLGRRPQLGDHIEPPAGIEFRVDFAAVLGQVAYQRGRWGGTTHPPRGERKTLKCTRQRIS